jgi:hypothetical protein
MVDDQRQVLVHWVHNNLAELTGASTYRVHQWWRSIWRRHAVDRREGKSPGSANVAFTEARLPAMDGLPIAVHCDVVMLLGTWRMGGKQPTPARIISRAAEQVGTVNHPVTRSEPIRAPRPFTPLGYPLCAEHESRRPVRIQARGHRRRGALHLRSFSGTVPSEPPSECLTERFVGP